jgi:hypothetical protein
MREGEGVELARRCLDEAQEGNSVSLRFCLGRIEPARRGRPVNLELLPGEERDVHAVFCRALRGVAEGELTPEEAYWIGRLAALKRATPLEPGLPNAPWDELDPEQWVWDGQGDEAQEAEDAEGAAAAPDSSSPCLLSAEASLPPVAAAQALLAQERGEAGGGNSPPLRQPAGVGLLPPPAPPQAGEEVIRSAGEEIWGTQQREERAEVAAEAAAAVAPGGSAPSPSHRFRDGPLPLPGGERGSGGGEGEGDDGATCFPPVFAGEAGVLAPAGGGGPTGAPPVLSLVFSGSAPRLRFRTTGEGRGL